MVLQSLVGLTLESSHIKCKRAFSVNLAASFVTKEYKCRPASKWRGWTGTSTGLVIQALWAQRWIELFRPNQNNTKPEKNESVLPEGCRVKPSNFMFSLFKLPQDFGVTGIKVMGEDEWIINSQLSHRWHFFPILVLFCTMDLSFHKPIIENARYKSVIGPQCPDSN